MRWVPNIHGMWACWDILATSLAFFGPLSSVGFLQALFYGNLTMKTLIKNIYGNMPHLFRKIFFHGCATDFISPHGKSLCVRQRIRTVSMSGCEGWRFSLSPFGGWGAAPLMAWCRILFRNYAGSGHFIRIDPLCAVRLSRAC